MTEHPEWVDASISTELPVLRARGEGQDLEYMAAFPPNARELAKEIAAFASTNAGTILIGVDNAGDLCGLTDTKSIEARDLLIRRIEGLCNGPIRPSITPSVRFAAENGETVLVLKIPRGTQPVYYCHNVPYVRHLTESRPARPEEVVERVEEWLSLQPRETNAHNEFYGDVIAVVRELLLWTGEVEERAVNPWLDSMKWMLESHGGELRRLSTTDSALELGLRQRLEHLADLADAAGNHQLFLGRESWEEFRGLVTQVEQAASEFKLEVIDPLDLDDRVREHALDELGQAARESEALTRRADTLVDQGRIQELQNEAAKLGRTVLRLCYWGLDREPPDMVERLRMIGRRLHLLETLRLTMGGSELQALVTGVRSGAEELQALSSELSG